MLRAFISYSRADLDFADQLALALQTHAFEVTLDRHSIAGAEDWKARLGDLITAADTVVFVLSPDSATSTICAWEIEEAVRQGKRVIPVLCRPLPNDVPIPGRLNALNVIFFYPEAKRPGSGFGLGLTELIAALRVDLAWVREHTRVAERARRWADTGRPRDLLARGSELAAWLDWRTQRRPNAPDITEVQHAYLNESEAAEQLRQSVERRTLTRIAIGIAGAAVVVLGLLGLVWSVAATNARNIGILFADEAQKNLNDGNYDAAMRWALAGAPTSDTELVPPAYAPAEFRATEALWNMRLQRQLSGHSSAIQTAAFSPDGTSIVTASYEETARLWDARTGAARAVLKGHEGTVNSAAFSPDGTSIVTASWDKTARIWDMSLFAKPLAERIRDACARLEETGAFAFTALEQERDSLSGRDPDPCNRQGLLSGAWWRKTYFSWW